MLNYPQTLIDQGEFGAASFELYHSDKKIIEGNEQASRLWPDRPDAFFVVGDNGFGEVFAIDMSDENCPVYGQSPLGPGAGGSQVLMHCNQHAKKP